MLFVNSMQETKQNNFSPFWIKVPHLAAVLPEE
jgi:hypothetical protein